ncbi:unnamed protein product [Spodoptera exigua]|nr:unnamed protein product [Spodoptera exigua]
MWSEWGCVVLMLNTVVALSPVVKIGAVFTEDARGGSTELAFKYAVYRINKERTLLPNSTLVYDIQYTPSRDSFQTFKKACAQIQSGAVALFSGVGPLLGNTLDHMSTSLHAPHLTIGPFTPENCHKTALLHVRDPRRTSEFSSPDNVGNRADGLPDGKQSAPHMATEDRDSGFGDLGVEEGLGERKDWASVNHTFTINLYPPRDLLTKAFAEFLSYLNWTRMGVIYEDYGNGKYRI